MAYTKACVVTILMMAMLGCSMGAQVYQVGDSVGWNSQGTDYKSWSSNKNFQVGDSIVFNYNPQFHNVLEVSKEDFKACSNSAPIATYTSGSDSVNLVSSKTYYFICGFPSMCEEGGQKIEIKVESSKDNNPTDSPPSAGGNTPTFFPPLIPVPPAGDCPPTPPGFPGIYYTHSSSTALSLTYHLVLLMVLPLCLLAFYLQ